MNKYYSPKKQHGWYADRNKRLVADSLAGYSISDLMIKYKLAHDWVISILSDYKDLQ